MHSVDDNDDNDDDDNDDDGNDDNKNEDQNEDMVHRSYDRQIIYKTSIIKAWL
jgi:hypothetical protein